jgi:ribulose-5-phosphate 4-epimerase/fuculose-1-phosphate aldolase
VLPFDVGVDAESRSGEVGQLLGQGKGFIMHNRGLMTVGAAIECAVSYYIRLENLCHAQLLCEAAIKGRGGQLVLVGDEEVKVCDDTVGKVLMLSSPMTTQARSTTHG